MKRIINITFLLIVTLFISNITYAQQADNNTPAGKFTIGAGDELSGIYPVAAAVSKILQVQAKVHKLYPTIVKNGGSIESVNSLVDKQLSVAVVGSDVQYRAYNGIGEWAGNRKYELRSIASFSPLVLYFLATEQSQIKTIMDLNDKNINLGNTNSSTRFNAGLILGSYGYSQRHVNTEFEYDIKESIDRLIDNRLQGVFITGLYPSYTIKNITKTLPIRIIDIAKADRLLQTYNGYRFMKLEKKFFKDILNPNDSVSVSTYATLVTTSSLPNYAAYVIAKELVENIEYLKRSHPAFKNLSVKDLVRDVATPIHPGAMRYYKDKGIL